MLRDLDHPAVRGEDVYDATYENVQPGDRAPHLFRLANYHSALVVDAGDLSELALGWTTYGVGDHMSHYNVNVSVPKTLIQFLLPWTIDTEQFSPDMSEVLRSGLDTETTPELIPCEDSGFPEQASESTEGPYRVAEPQHVVEEEVLELRARLPISPTTPGTTATPVVGPTWSP